MISPTILFIGSFFEFFGDMGFIIKIFALLAIIGFLNQHMQNPTIKVIVFMFMTYFILFANWSVFGTVWIIYTLLGLGISGVLVDFFFVSAQSGHDPSEMAQQQGGDSGKGGKEAIEHGLTPYSTVGQGKAMPKVRPPMM